MNHASKSIGLNERAVAELNDTGRQPALFIHGLWLHPSSWDRWQQLFEAAGYTCAAPAWPDDAETVSQARLAPKASSESLGNVVEALADQISKLERKPVIIGHSFGGLIAQLLADKGLSAATVGISPAAFRGVLPLPFSALKSASPVLLNLGNRHQHVALTLEQFQFAFANAVTPQEAKQLYDDFAVPAPGGPLFEAAFANLNPWTDDQLNRRNPDRGPMLLIAGEDDHTVPPAVVTAEYKLQGVNQATTEMTEIPGRGHSLVIDSGWRDVAEIALQFCSRFSPARQDTVDEAEAEPFPASDPAAY